MKNFYPKIICPITSNTYCSTQFSYTVKHGYREHAYNELALQRSDFHSPLLYFLL